MTNKSIKLNSGNIINIRKNIDETKKKYWNIIKTTNLLTNKEVKNGFRTHDIKELYNKIMQLSEKLVYVKGMLFYLNMGITTFNKEDFKKTNNYNIFMATEMKEAITKLSCIPTLNEKTKAQKGLKAIGKSEVLSSAKIASLIKGLQVKANKFDAEMEKFNKGTEIDITSLGETFKNDLIA